jgi:N-acetylneuraminic acid mutarotase
MLRNGVFLLSLLLLLNLGHAQNVGIGTPTPHPSAVLDVTATDKGLLPPRLTTAQRDGISNPVPGLMLFNTDTRCMEYWNGSQWISTCATTAPCIEPPKPAIAASPSPVCEGQTLNLTASTIGGATYVWTGPGGYYNTTQNPSLPNVTLSQAGTYTCRVFLGGCWSGDTSVTVTVLDDRWHQANGFPFTARETAAGFLIGDTLYLGTGRVSCGNELRDFYAYHIPTDTWVSKGLIPVNGSIGRSGVSAFALAGLGYLGGGNYNCGFTFKRWYRYSPTTGGWTEVAAYPTHHSHTFQNLTHGTEGLVAMGHCGSDTYDSPNNCTVSCNSVAIRGYDPGTNTWVARGSLPYTAPNGNIEQAAALTIGGRAFVGLGGKQSYSCSGIVNFTNWYEYNSGTNSWVARASYPGTGGRVVSYFAIGTHGYVIGSNRAIYRYDSVADSWTQLSCPYPGTAKPSVGVSHSGLGYVFDTDAQRTWVFTP